MLICETENLLKNTIYKVGIRAAWENDGIGSEDDIAATFGEV